MLELKQQVRLKLRIQLEIELKLKFGLWLDSDLRPRLEIVLGVKL